MRDITMKAAMIPLDAAYLTRVTSKLELILQDESKLDDFVERRAEPLFLMKSPKVQTKFNLKLQTPEFARFSSSIRKLAIEGAVSAFLKSEYPDSKSICLQYMALRHLARFQNMVTSRKPRMIHVHEGPTNSGKTHAAMTKLLSSNCGVYLAPLRLLAMENFQRISRSGLPCDLITGQERPEGQPKNHASCTIEAVPINRDWEVAVVDEAQLIGTEDRGFAWTRALMNLRASEIHVCGDGSFTELIRKLLPNDVFQISRYKRLSRAVIQVEPIESVSNLLPGDCLVLFSRREILGARGEIEARTLMKAAVVYGSLPPETRRAQCEAFNSGNLEILISSDCVAMGLNFHVKRIVFGKLTKFDGVRNRKLEKSEIRQIAGRAGRFDVDGKIACVREDDVPFIFNAFDLDFSNQDTIVPDNLEISSLTKAAVFPDIPQLCAFLKEYCVDFDSGESVDLDDGKNFSAALGNFFDFSSGSEIVFVPRSAAERIISVSLALEDIRMPWNLRLPLIFAPLPSDAAVVLTALRRVAIELANFAKVDLPLDLQKSFWPTTRTKQELIDLENVHAVCDFYCWLRNQDIPVEDARDARIAVADAITRSLAEPGNFLTTDEERALLFSAKCS